MNLEKYWQEYQNKFQVLSKKYVANRDQKEQLDIEENNLKKELIAISFKIDAEVNSLENANAIIEEYNKTHKKNKRKKIFVSIINNLLILISLAISFSLLYDAFLVYSLMQIFLFSLSTSFFFCLLVKQLLSFNFEEEKELLPEQDSELLEELKKEKEEINHKLINNKRLQNINLDHYNEILKEKEELEIIMLNVLNTEHKEMDPDIWLDISLRRVRKKK